MVLNAIHGREKNELAIRPYLVDDALTGCPVRVRRHYRLTEDEQICMKLERKCNLVVDGCEMDVYSTG